MNNMAAKWPERQYRLKEQSDLSSSDLTNGTIEMKICTVIQKTCPLLKLKTKLRMNEQYGRQMAGKTI